MVGQQLNGWSGEQIRKHQFGCVALHVIDVFISGVDELYIQSSRGVGVIFLCRIWLFEYIMVLFKCLIMKLSCYSPFVVIKSG
jgi:hypothetical protein